jgi:serine/threonine protein phosphatase 1
MLRNTASEGNHQRLLVVGDIHGHVDKLRNVLTLSRYNPQRDRLVLLGDYVDRGPESCEVVTEVIRLVEAGAVALYGNHEDLMRAALKNHRLSRVSFAELESWYANGGEITLASYRARAECLDEHLSFLASLPRWYEEAGFLFVHAGVRAGIAIQEQSPHDLIWIREPYILEYNSLQYVVTGHTPTQYLARYNLFDDIVDASKPVVRGQKIFLDTGAAWGGPLTIMELPSQKIWQV